MISHSKQLNLVPEELVLSTWQLVSNISVGVFIVSLLSLFVALALVAHSLKGELLSSRGEVVLKVALLGPTIFPIVFAAAVGRAIYKADLRMEVTTWFMYRNSRGLDGKHHAVRETLEDLSVHKQIIVLQVKFPRRYNRF